MNLQGVFDFAAVERFKDMGQVFRLNSNAVILNRDSDLRPLLAHSFFSPDTDPPYLMALEMRFCMHRPRAEGSPNTSGISSSRRFSTLMPPDSKVACAFESAASMISRISTGRRL